MKSSVEWLNQMRAQLREALDLADAAPLRGDPEHEELVKMVETAWTIIANAGYGDWETQGSEWKEAAERFREHYHAWLGVSDVVYPKLQTVKDREDAEWDRRLNQVLKEFNEADICGPTMTAKARVRQIKDILSNNLRP